MEIRFVDVETTGLGPGAELVEIAVLDQGGATLFESLVCPSDPWGYIAEEIHGIRASELASAPRFRDLAPKLAQVLDGTVIAAHGVAFDLGMLEADFARAGVRPPRWPE